MQAALHICQMSVGLKEFSYSYFFLINCCAKVVLFLTLKIYLFFFSAQSTGRILTNSGGTIRQTPSLETRSLSQKRRVKGKPTEPKVCMNKVFGK